MWSPVGLRWVLATAMLVTAVYHIGRIAMARPPRRRCDLDVDMTHAAMSVGMSLMLVGSLGAHGNIVWLAVFAAATLWFVVRTTHGYVMHGVTTAGPHAREALGCAVMLGMLAITAVATAHAGLVRFGANDMAGMAMPRGSSTADTHVITAALLLVMVGVSIWTAAGLSPARRGSLAWATVDAPRVQTRAPNLTAGCQLATNATAVYMLALML